MTSFTIPGIICTADAPLPTTLTILSLRDTEESNLAECIKGPLKFLNISGIYGVLSGPGPAILEKKC